MKRFACWILSGALAAGVTGCKSPEITCMALSPQNMVNCDKDGNCGIPFYLPKPLLIIAKNFHNIEEAKVGQLGAAPIPDEFDSQAEYGTLNAAVAAKLPGKPTGGDKESGVAGPFTAGGAPVVPGRLPQDEFLSPRAHYTYHIVFVPDLSQKYGLKIKGGAGEFRAAMNLVNGWQFTGVGPFYLKDSSTAQNLLAGGLAFNFGAGGVADVLNSVNDLRARARTESAGAVAPGQLAQVVQTIRRFCPAAAPINIPDYAEIRVYEPQLQEDGRTVWVPVVKEAMSRTLLGTVSEDVIVQPVAVRSDTSKDGGSGKKESGAAVLPQPGAVIETKETKETKESKETKETKPKVPGMSRLDPSGNGIRLTGGQLPADGLPGPIPVAPEVAAPPPPAPGVPPELPPPVVVPHDVPLMPLTALPPAERRFLDAGKLTGAAPPTVTVPDPASDKESASAVAGAAGTARLRDLYAARALGLPVGGVGLGREGRLESASTAAGGAAPGGNSVVINNQTGDCAPCGKEKGGLFSWFCKKKPRVEQRTVLGESESVTVRNVVPVAPAAVTPAAISTGPVSAPVTPQRPTSPLPGS